MIKTQQERKNNILGRREKPKLDDARKLRGIYYVDPHDKECNETLKHVRKKLEVHLDSATPCTSRKTSGNTSSEAPKGPKKRSCDDYRQGENPWHRQHKGETVNACKCEAHELTEGAQQRLKSKIMKITLPKKVSILWVIFTSCTNFFLCPSH